MNNHLATWTEFGLASFDAETQRVDLFTLEGEHIRGFDPGFIPAVMSFSRRPSLVPDRESAGHQ